ncbi:hypothetical protein [Acinetobacter sp. NIPH 2699]|uniref:hypothetical protein n=1 Tax=Acinetobacter sp. NIPH 2699 TaxID=2923433 RepID=UPI001F4ACE94|nr:hypothetical protein [Acinetobacter sp. NIPH 2699]MCH7337520.1 hypothetical protein [Acinetobacter sp. NIPH 2699]
MVFNKNVRWDVYLKHSAIAMGLMFITAVLSGMLQELYSVDGLGVLAFILMGSLGFILLVAFLSLYLIFKTYLYHTVSIDWVAVADGDIQLSVLQKIIKSDIAFWMAFIFPFLFSILTYVVRSKTARMKN